MFEGSEIRVRYVCVCERERERETERERDKERETEREIEITIWFNGFLFLFFEVLSNINLYTRMKISLHHHFLKMEKCPICGTVLQVFLCPLLAG